MNRIEQNILLSAEGTIAWTPVLIDSLMQISCRKSLADKLDTKSHGRTVGKYISCRLTFNVPFNINSKRVWGAVGASSGCVCVCVCGGGGVTQNELDY